jgi:hypothetical protein
MLARRTILDSLVLAALCSTAYADRPITAPVPTPHIALGVAPPRLRAPYDVQVLRGDGLALPTYALGGRYYVEGSEDERYVIRITNPTAHRIEAVVSVDGLDVIDGENGDLRKRGYVVPAYGETRIEGFRTSQADVATFRFSGVADSYADQKGNGRNIGVIAVAVFEETRPTQQIIVGDRVPHRPRFERDDSRAGNGAASKAAPAPSAAPGAGAARGDFAPNDAMAEQSSERPGLGTQFGEQRDSEVSYTRFVRAPGRPVAIAELRYNDESGLLALGIPVRGRPDGEELRLRETADPFPGDRFAQPPR